MSNYTNWIIFNHFATLTQYVVNLTKTIKLNNLNNSRKYIKNRLKFSLLFTKCISILIWTLFILQKTTDIDDLYFDIYRS